MNMTREELVEAANKAWIDYEPPKTAMAQTHRQAILSKHAFVAGFIASTQAPPMAKEG